MRTIDTYSLKQHLIDNEDLIELLLRKAGFYYIDGDFKHGEEFRCAWDEDSSPTGVSVNKETLASNYFSKAIKGDIIMLLGAKLNLSFPKTLQFIKDTIDFEEDEVEYILPFGGFFKSISKSRKFNYSEVKTYDESILNDYLITPNKMFFDDGISIEVQQKYKVGYDVMTNRIIVPWWSYSGELIGLMGRLNKQELEEWESKWFPIQAFAKSQTLFGFSHNYNNMIEKSAVIISESEKAPMLLESKGINFGVGLGGSNLSEQQANNLKSLLLDTYIIGLDEGMDEEVSVVMAEKLKMNTFHTNKVGYIYDKNNTILPKGSKIAPADLDKADIARLLKHHTKWI